MGIFADIGYTAVAGITWGFCELFSIDTPEWAFNRLWNVEGRREAVLKDPMLIVEGLSQGATDAVEQKGIAYCAGYITGSIITDIGIAKGFKVLYAKVGGKKPVQTIDNKFPMDNQVGKSFSYTLENGRVHIENGVQNVDFVIDMDGKLHIGRGHSHLSGGSPVQAAGTMKVNSQGYIRLITNETGHFQPTTIQALNYPTVFRNAGLNVENA